MYVSAADNDYVGVTGTFLGTPSQHGVPSRCPGRSCEAALRSLRQVRPRAGAAVGGHAGPVQHADQGQRLRFFVVRVGSTLFRSLLYVLYVLYLTRQAAEPPLSPGSLLYVLYVLYLTRQPTEHQLSPGSLLYVLYVLYGSYKATH